MKLNPSLLKEVSANCWFSFPACMVSGVATYKAFSALAQGRFEEAKTLSSVAVGTGIVAFALSKDAHELTLITCLFAGAIFGCGYNDLRNNEQAIRV